MFFSFSKPSSCLLYWLVPLPVPFAPPAGGVSLTSFQVDLEGSGCQPGDASVAIARDNSAMTIIFDKFEAAEGPKKGTAKSRAFCRGTIGVNSPDYAFDITSADFHGYVNVEEGVEASLVSRWKWVDSNGVDLKGKVNGHRNGRKIIKGPFQDDVLLQKNGELSGSEATDCQKKDAMIQISLSATVSAGSFQNNGYVQGSSQDVGFGETLNLSSKKC
ncbi:hypothetical protein EK21DRAFT_62486 [Setomelanomma holmii]|uniref:Uncharacterized protein n=1 Tax=Setomelanomma holmii TaxID=210430 RepID=A0A9P4LQE4_9PLEO|nr:hypothetical protein EK21DRAFT_62486 [Setomelanomma holmii]